MEKKGAAHYSSWRRKKLVKMQLKIGIEVQLFA
jgi:hypothetical protein